MPAGCRLEKACHSGQLSGCWDRWDAAIAVRGMISAEEAGDLAEEAEAVSEVSGEEVLEEGEPGEVGSP